MREADLPRPDPPPVRFPVMLQDWCGLTFLHWRFPVAVVQRLVPPALQVESFDGSAWVGVTPFVLRDLRPPGLPALPWLSRFPETNCRTYVKGPDGGSGVWFFSLDAARLPAVAAARLSYGLPYAWSRMRVMTRGARTLYESSRTWPDRKAGTQLTVEAGAPLGAGELETFLTARFRLYSFIGGRLCFANVDHPPWPLREARLIEGRQTLTTAAGLPDVKQPASALYSPGVHTRISAPKRVSL